MYDGTSKKNNNNIIKCSTTIYMTKVVTHSYLSLSV